MVQMIQEKSFGGETDILNFFDTRGILYVERKSKNYLSIYLFIYLSIFELSLHVVKDCLTNKYQRNKQKK